MTRVVLLTGGAGFVGRQVLAALLTRRCRVRLVVRTGGKAAAGPQEDIESTVTTPDLFAESAAWWETACRGVDTVIHVAWYAEPGTYLRSPKNIDCLIGTLQLAKGAAQSRVRRFVGVGTCFEYDLSGGFLSVDAPLAPSTPYAASKAAAFLALSKLLPARDVQFAWARLFYLYGEHEDSRRLVPYLRARLAAGDVAELTSGTQVRDYLDVREAGRLIADLGLGDVQGATNICSGTPITVRALAERIADEYGRRDLLKFGARPDNLIDPPVVVGVR